MAGDARSVADELRNQGKDQPAKLAEQAAQRAESLGDYLQRSDGDTILRDVEDFGRQPAVGGHRRRPRARVRGLALPEGVEQPSLRVERWDDRSDAHDHAAPRPPAPA